MKMSSREFVSTVRMNEKYEYIKKDTKFSVYQLDFKYVCTVTVDKTTVKYGGDHPSDLLTGDYLFIEQKD